MLHSKKSQSILQWYNSLTTKGDVNSLQQFTDGSHFYEIVASLQPFLFQGSKERNLAAESVIFSETSIACNEEVITSVEEEAAEGKMETSVSESVNADPFVIKESDHTDTQKKYDAIRKFIDDFYHVESSSLIDYGECQKGKELELAKVAIFLLSAMVQNLVSSEDKVVYNTTLLELEVQENIHECLTLVLDEKDMGEKRIKKSELHKVLSRASCKGIPLRKQPSRSNPDPNDSPEGVKNAFKKRKERTSVTVYEDLQNSPLKNLLESPKFQYRAALLRKESELAKLRSALRSEENKVIDLTLEKQNVNAELEKKKKELEFYKKKLESQREALGKKEEHEKLREEELKNKNIEAERLRKLIESQEEEIKHLKESNEALQEKVVDLEKKMEQDGAISPIKENNDLKDKIQTLERDNKEKADLIKDLNEKIDNIKYRQDISAPNNRRELRSTIIYADEQTSRETLERQELRQDIEIKDKRIKRLPRKGETSKEKKVDHLNQEKSILEKQPNELRCGSTSDGTSVDLNSIKKESDRIGLAAHDADSSYNKLDGQLQASVSNDSQHSKTDSFFSECQQYQFLTCLLKKMQNNLQSKHSYVPMNPITRSFSEIKNLEELCFILNELEKEIICEKEDKCEKEEENSCNSPSVTPRRKRSRAAEEVDTNSLIEKNQKLSDSLKSFQLQSGKTEEELIKAIKTLEASKIDLIKEIENLKQEAAIDKEKYINMKKLAKKKDDDVKRGLIMYHRIVKVNKKDKDSKKECGEECEKLRKRCKKLNEECLDFEQRELILNRSNKDLEGRMEHLQFQIKELKEENEELRQKLWEETSVLSKNTTDRDALVLHYLKKSKHELKKNKDIELKKEEQRKSSRPIVKIDAYILNSESEESMSNAVLASRSIRSSYFQVADEDDFLNESSLAEIHNRDIPEGESGENRLLEQQQRNNEVSFDLGRKSSLYNVKRDNHQKPKSKYVESDSDDSDDCLSFPVKKHRISETDRISVPVSKKQCRPSSSLAKGPSKDQEDPRKPSTPCKRKAAVVIKKSYTFSTNRLMIMSRKNKTH